MAVKQTKKRKIAGGTLAQRARRARLARGYTMLQAAKESGLGLGAISEIESGIRANVTTSTLEALARTYGVPGAALIPF